MYICVCNGVTDRDIHEAIKQGAERMRDLRICLGVAGQCGACACHAKMALDKNRELALSSLSSSAS